MTDSTEQPKLSWWRRLSGGLKRTSNSLGSAVADLVTKRKLDRAMLEDIEDVLLRADLGTIVAARIAVAAGDTFRAAAIEQLKIWGERTKSPVISGAQGSDSASLAFNALSAAREQRFDVLLIDTAGRLQNKAELMNELEKVVRVIRKVD